MPDHDARDPGAHSSTEARHFETPNDTEDSRDVGGLPGRAEAGEVLCAARDATRREAPGERYPELWTLKVSRAKGTIWRIEHRCQIDVHAHLAQRPPRGASGIERGTRRAKLRGGSIRRQARVALHGPTLLVDIDQRTRWTRGFTIVCEDDDPAGTTWRGQPGDDDESRLRSRR